jgi:hypothetical protein
MANNTSQTQFNSFDIPQGGYVAFDAMSLRQLIINRLNEQNIFTDQNFIGSNLSSIIDIIAYSYNTLIYYLNKTSNESMFSEAQLYENINRIVKLIDYSPVGNQTSTLSFTCSANGLTQGVYTIPLYSYITTNGINFSFNNNISFNKSIDNVTEELTNFENSTLLYQGKYVEYPLYTATGEENEVHIVNPGTNIVDHFNIDVYVQPAATGTWVQYTPSPNLFLENGSATKYQIRLNQNLNYEITFGNDVNGTRLHPGDQVAVYYLASNGADGQVGPGALNSTSTLIGYNTDQYNKIVNDVFVNQYQYLNSTGLTKLTFANSTNSTIFNPPETVQSIQNNAPANYRSQNRLVTTQDYTTFVKTNFGNLIADVKCVNNNDYIAGYMKYFYDIGITNPQITDRALFNQVTFSDTCNFNNIYVVVVPKSNAFVPNYLLPAQKQLISSSISTNKVATTETVFVDPIYKAVSIGLASTLDQINLPTDQVLCTLNVKKTATTLRSNQAIISDIVNVFANYFNSNNFSLGQMIDVRNLTQQIYAVDGVQTFYTARIDNPSVYIEGLSLFAWNPIYPTLDATFTSNNIILNYYEFPYYDNINNLSNQINIIGS